MESWRRCWREGVAPLLSYDGLEALRRALLADDERLVQGITVCRSADGTVLGCCPVAYVGWRAEGLLSLAELEEFFGRMAEESGKLLGEASGMRWLTNFWDEGPREEARRHLLAEVNLSIAGRTGETEAAATPAGAEAV